MSLKLISKEHISLKSYFDKDSAGVDLDEYLRNNEKKIPNIKVGVEKRIIWYDKKIPKLLLQLFIFTGLRPALKRLAPYLTC